MKVVLYNSETFTRLASQGWRAILVSKGWAMMRHSGTTGGVRMTYSDINKAWDRR